MVKEGLWYTKSHEWIKELEADVYEIGLSDHAQSELGDLVFVNLPQADDEVTLGEAAADVESVKAVSDVYSPVTGTVGEVNEALLDTPELINQDPYGAWLFRVKGVTEKGEWMDAAAYQEFLDKEE